MLCQALEQGMWTSPGQGILPNFSHSRLLSSKNAPTPYSDSRALVDIIKKKNKSYGVNEEGSDKFLAQFLLKLDDGSKA